MKTGTKVLIGIIGAAIVFLLGFILGINSAATYYTTIFKIAQTLTWVIPVLIVIIIAILVISFKRNQKRKAKKEQFEAEAKNQSAE